MSKMLIKDDHPILRKQCVASIHNGVRLLIEHAQNLHALGIISDFSTFLPLHFCNIETYTVFHFWLSLFGKFTKFVLYID